MYKRYIYQILKERLAEPRRFIQVLTGPRQVGKSTVAEQVVVDNQIIFHSISADEPTIHNSDWLAQQWDIGRLKATQQGECLLIIDEVQKIPHWSETIKRLWDEDTKHKARLKVLLLGSAPLLIQQGLTESLAGRFELIRATHWNYAEMKAAFGWDLNQYLFYGGYPGAASFISDELRWKRYIADSLIEPTISRDILLLNRIDKPALLRQLFKLGCDYSGQIVSFQKMLGQLQDAGNTTTLAHYLELLGATGMLTGLQKYAGNTIRQRSSSPKLQILNTALISANAKYNCQTAQEDRNYWGRLVESAVGAYLANNAAIDRFELFYWREGNEEVDFVLQKNDTIVALEVGSGRKKNHLSGMAKFNKLYHPKRKLLIGGQGIPLEEFFLTPPNRLLE